MARIRLFSVGSASRKLYLRVTIRAEKQRAFGTVFALFDTGCPKALLITERYAQELGIPTSSLEQDGSVAIGSQKYFRHVLPDVDLFLRDENNQTVRIKLPEVTVLRSIKHDEASRQEARVVPCLIGVDFIPASGLALHFLPTGEVYMEK